MTQPQTAGAMVERFLEEARTKRDGFLAAWREVVMLIGPAYFYGDPKTATCVEVLAPREDAYERRLRTASSGERLFMLAAYQFYNDRKFKERPSLADLSASLDEHRVDVLLRLLKHYHGW